ncbi:DUF4012 domain-containing protein [Humibacter albus]|uniref:DUF4012 domain-containing protein n=1 Tax=Humibacter albus TaxID=427754 RepID=UPI0003B30ED5|nr:DUF4012 domain-containing protein [Humibacter albus]
MSGPAAAPARMTKRTRRRIIGWSIVGVVVLLLACAAWVAVRGLQAKSELEAALPLVDRVQSQIASGDSHGAAATARTLAQHLHVARDDTSDPIWRAAEITPFVGSNLTAVRKLAESASDVADHAVTPLTRLAGTIDLKSFTPVDGRVPLKPLQKAAPTLTSANTALQSGLDTVRSIDTSSTIGVITDAVDKLTSALEKAGSVTDAASRAARLLPGMLGANGPRDYVLVIQNNAEARSTGGIVGALALLRAQDGRISLVSQASASDFPQFTSPVRPLSTATKKLYGEITGEWVQDTTLTPDFATSGALVRAMWEKRYGTKVDGVLSMDPVALSYLLNATGPVDLGDGEQLTSENAVNVLLSESYARFNQPKEQDAFFAGTAAAVFDKVASGQFDSGAMLAALTRASEERRVLVWSAHKHEPSILGGTTLAGSLPESSGAESRFGVYLNDATGAKMDYYLHTSIGLQSAKCRADGRVNYLVRVTLSSDAPADAATSLPWYVTGAGLSGVPAGDTHTTVAVYAPRGFVAIGAASGGKDVVVQRATDQGRAVAQLLVKLTPGQSATYDFQFLSAPLSDGSPGSPHVQSTPGVWATAVRRVSFGCSDVLG